jgi:hypothetical protein
MTLPAGQTHCALVFPATRPSLRLDVRQNGWGWLWFPSERRFWSFQEQGFPRNCRITNSVPAVELAWGYCLTLGAENQRQKYAPPAGNGAVSRTWDSRNDPTLKFSESGTSAPCLVKLLPAFTNIRVQRKRVLSRSPKHRPVLDSIDNNL